MSIGAARTLGYLGVLSQVHRACTPQELQERDEKAAEFVKTRGAGFLSTLTGHPVVQAEFYDKPEAQLRREVELLTVAAQYERLPIVVVFGSKHKLAASFADPKVYDFIVPADFPAEGTSPRVTMAPFSAKDRFLFATGAAIAFVTGLSWRRRRNTGV